MKVQELLDAYYEASGKASELSRQLAFAGIAIIWLFRVGEQGGGIRFSEALLVPLFCFVGGLALDLGQYVYKSIAWSALNTVLSLAVRSTQLCLTSRKFCLLILLGVACNIQAMDQTSNTFNLVLSSAINGDKKQLQQLTHAGGSIDVVDSRGRSAVLVVTIENNIEALRLLIELGADVDYYDKSKSQGVIDQTAFLYAGAKGMNDALVLLMNAGARPDIYNYYGGTALIPAAEKGHLNTVKLLLEKSNIDVNHVNDLGWTALMEAVILSDGGANQQQIVRLLLTHGADPEITDKEGISILTHARNRGFTAIVELLNN